MLAWFGLSLELRGMEDRTAGTRRINISKEEPA
jgi:hypothetical protein